MAFELEIRDSRYCKGNRYKILVDKDRFVQLECVWYCDKEDLGDQIYCTHEGQQIWIAKYHSETMKTIEI